MGYLDEVLYGKKRTDDTAHATELRALQILELSGVDSAASGFDGWLLTKAEGKTDPKSLTDDELDARIADYERAASENPHDLFLLEDLQNLKAERARRQRQQKPPPVAKSAQSWGQRLVRQGGKITFR